MIASLRTIPSLDLPDLEPFRTLRRPLDHLQQGIFVAEGEKVVVRLLRSDIVVQRVLLSEDWFAVHRPLLESNPNDIDVLLGSKKLLESIVGHDLHQSIMGMGLVPAPVRPTQLSLDPDRSSLTVLVDGITNAENMGVIVRNCVCFGVSALLVLPSSCDPYLRRSVRNSMGNIFRLPIVYLQDPAVEIRMLKERGLRFLAAHPQPGSIDVRSSAVRGHRCLVLGAEGHGVSPDILDICDEHVVIPMREGADSLNVASASAVLLWELFQTTKP